MNEKQLFFITLPLKIFVLLPPMNVQKTQWCEKRKAVSNSFLFYSRVWKSK